MEHIKRLSIKYLILPLILIVSLYLLDGVDELVSPMVYFGLVGTAKMAIMFMLGYMIRVATVGRIDWSKVDDTHKAVVYAIMLVSLAIAIN